MESAIQQRAPGVSAWCGRKDCWAEVIDEAEKKAKEEGLELETERWAKNRQHILGELSKPKSANVEIATGKIAFGGSEIESMLKQSTSIKAGPCSSWPRRTTKWFNPHSGQFDYRRHLEFTADYIVRNCIRETRYGSQSGNHNHKR